MLMGKKNKPFVSIFAVMVLFIFTLALIDSTASAAEDPIKKAERINTGCLKCHGAQGLKTTLDGKTVSLYVDEKMYKTSTHGTMPCTYCHTDRTYFPHVNGLKGRELVNYVNSQCARCHKDMANVYQRGVHSRFNAQKGRANALCSDCHGVHNIYKKEDARSTVNHNKSVNTCAKCHEKIMKSYEESFHGKSVILGGKEAASCVSCHGSHTITGPKDAASTVSKQNIPKTCGKCHLYSFENFTKGKEHYYLTPKDPAGVPMFYTLMFFTWLTIVVVTFCILHMEMELYRKFKNASKPDVK